MDQWIHAYGPISSTVRIACVSVANDNIRGDKRSGFRDIEGFLRTYPASTDTTRAIEVSFNAILQRPSAARLDSVDMVVTIKSKSGVGFHRASADSEEVYYPESEYNLTIEVKYTDYLVAKGALTTVEDWATSLEKQKVSGIPKFFRAFFADTFFDSFNPARLTVIFFPAAVSILTVFGLSRPYGYFGGLAVFDWAQWLLILGTIYLFLFSLLVTSLRQLQRSGASILRHFLLSYGDTTAFEKLRQKNNELEKKRHFYMVTLGVSLVVGITASLLANFLSK